MLKRRIDPATGDVILECETVKEADGRLRYVWNPTPEEFAAYKVRDAAHAAHNAFLLMVRRILEEPVTSPIVQKGIPAEEYRGYFPVPASDEPYIIRSRKVGGTPIEHHAHTATTMGAAVSDLNRRGGTT